MPRPMHEIALEMPIRSLSYLGHYRWALLLLAVIWTAKPLGAQDAADEAAFARQLPNEAKQHVYLFFLNGIDPLEFGQLSALRDYCRELGFERSWYGQFYHRWYFQRIIEDIWQRDPEGRFVIIGFSAGAVAARDLANALNRENIPIDLLVYIGGATLTNSPHNRPENVRRLIHVRANDLIFRGWAIEGADNVKCQDAWHFGTPNHPETRRRLAEALAEVAGQVPVAQPPPLVRDHANGAPRSSADDQDLAEHSSPLRLTGQLRRASSSSGPSDLTGNSPHATWEFLKATRQLRSVPPPDYSGLPYQSGTGK